MEHGRKGNYDVTIENVTDDMSCLSVAGPYSRDVLSKLTSTDMSNSGFKFLTIKDIEIAGLPLRAMRISYTGEQRSLNDFFFWGGGRGIDGNFCDISFFKISRKVKEKLLALQEIMHCVCWDRK